MFSVGLLFWTSSFAWRFFKRFGYQISIHHSVYRYYSAGFIRLMLPSCRLVFPPPMPPHVLVDFVVLPPGHGRSVTDFSGWDAHEAQLRCPDDVSGDIGGCSARRALKPKFF